MRKRLNFLDQFKNTNEFLLTLRYFVLAFIMKIRIQATTAIAATAIAETTAIAD